MIRQLTEEDDVLCQQLIRQKPAENLFIIGDIEAFGYQQDFQKIWGDFSVDGELRAILLKYEVNFIPFALGEFDVEGFAKVINENEYQVVSGLDDIIEQMEPFLNRTITSNRKLYYAKCNQLKANNQSTDENVKLVSIDDLPRLEQLLRSVPEFQDLEFNYHSKQRNIESGVSRSYYIEQDERMVSTVSTAAENSMSAMIVGVGTEAEYKRRGYATKCLVQLCQDVLAEGKELCLFYDNPDAGKIYKRIGFSDIGFWKMLKVK
ncbi:GNAT family N-acetyltransferase [Aquibacillus saliphilus]|uniref:GNAT family N-acetyltransferase n=1 Tax=Aquibacillus saliphilus TaxID=1909422 RepID=UPI001CEFBD32|nr:GNAT family N-acetyltransferase [Aquibacillus saliphilus]